MTKVPTSARPKVEQPADPMKPAVYQVDRTKREAHDTFTLELSPQKGGACPVFLPGQFNMLDLPGVGECAVSISGDPADGSKMVHTVRVGDTVTQALKKLKQGDTVGLRGPFGAGWPVSKAVGHDIVFVAGGIGLATLRPAIYHVVKHRSEYGRVVLLYGARTPKDILYRAEMKKWKGRLDIEVHATVDCSDDGWHGNVGVVPQLIRRAPFDRLHTTAFICGPEVMMRFAVLDLQKRGLPDKSIHVSMERNMKCAIGFCDHCPWGPEFICKEGPVFSYDRARSWLDQRIHETVLQKNELEDEAAV